MKKDKKAKQYEPSALHLIMDRFYEDENVPAKYYENFFNGIELFGANIFILHDILLSNIDEKMTGPDLYGGINKTHIHKFCDAYMKAEMILTQLSKNDLPPILKEMIAMDLEDLAFKRINLNIGPKHKSIIQQMTCQAYLLYGYIKHVRISKLYDPEDYKIDCHDAEIYNSIAKIFKRVYSKSLLPWPVTSKKVRYLLRNADNLESKKLRELNKNIKFYTKL